MGDTGTSMNEAQLTTSLGDIPLTARGKVRDLYGIGDELVFIATDRISAFDHVLGSGIPDKGKILTQLSHFWFDFLTDTVSNHLLAQPSAKLVEMLAPYQSEIAGRSMIVKRAKMFPVECVVRGYISGSGWKDYKATGSVCGIELPQGLVESDKLPEPIFTPAAKINTGGHDQNISYAVMIETIGERYAAELRRLTFAIYEKASAHAASKGLILADTKFEFGLVNGEIVLADEVLTPDSSRYWPAALYSPGGPQPSFDKQYVRDYLDSIHWNKQAPAPSLPDLVIEKTREKYLEAFRLITASVALETNG